jgi:hypothetical protein
VSCILRVSSYQTVEFESQSEEHLMAPATSRPEVVKSRETCEDIKSLESSSEWDLPCGGYGICDGVEERGEVELEESC